jgi:hypothetical protein
MTVEKEHFDRKCGQNDRFPGEQLEAIGRIVVNGKKFVVK